MKTIIPDVDALIDNVNAQLDTMLELTGGESGRDFTRREQAAWDKLIEARRQLQLVNDLQTEDTKDLSRPLYMVTDPQSGAPCRYLASTPGWTEGIKASKRDIVSEVRYMMYHAIFTNSTCERLNRANRDALEQELCVLLDAVGHSPVARTGGSALPEGFHGKLHEILDRLEAMDWATGYRSVDGVQTRRE
jgi:hypothetical protein